MGRLENGKWTASAVAPTDEQGKFNREESSFRSMISDTHEVFKPEKDRYHLYVSYACPWAHRALIYRQLKKLNDVVSVSSVHPEMLENGWEFRTDFPGATGDPIEGKDYLYEIYQLAEPTANGKVTVPVLWDKKTKSIVNNESSEIIRIFNSSFNSLTGDKADFYPEEYRSQIDEINDFIYENINDGVYKTGFAKSQKAYEEAVKSLYLALDKLEDEFLSSSPFLLSSQPLECDWRLFTTLVRFDLVYYFHFKCNLKRIVDYPRLNRYMNSLLHWPGVRETIYLDHIKHHYFYSHTDINPTRIVPLGPPVQSILDLR